MTSLGVAATLWARTINTTEPPVIPTVHPVLTPLSAINLPLNVRADSIRVWTKGSEQRLLLEGNVSALLGYRVLHANKAALTLTPTRDGGESTFDVAIFLVGDVKVQEGTSPKAPVTTAGELLVTTRIMNAVQLAGATPVAQRVEDDPAVKRGDVLREELLNKPAPLVFLPRITITDIEYALQNGWIARGAGNRIIAGPAETALATGPATAVPTTNAAPGTPAAPKPIPRPQVFATADEVKYETVGKEQVAVLQGSFYMLYTPADGGPPMELTAQRAVLFFADNSNRPPESEKGLNRLVTAVYLEGDVTMQTDSQGKGANPVGNETVRAERVYYDVTSNRAVMMDAVLSAVDQQRNVPLYMQASEIRQIARGEYAAKNVKFSISEFHTPHYHIGASDAYLQDITPRDENNRAVGPQTYGIKTKNDTFNIQGVPVFWWPFLAADTSKNDIPLRKIVAGSSKNYGLSIQTDWDIFGLAGRREPKGVRADLNIDYFQKRGPAGGLDTRWNFEDSYGLLRTRVMQDNGSDQLGKDRTDLQTQSTARGRVLGREHLALDENWSLQLEVSKISDPNYLESFFPDEYETGKENETVAQLKYVRETEALTILGKWSLYDYTANADLVDDQYTTEKKPEIKYWRIGESVLGIFTYYLESGVANMSQMFTNYTPGFFGLQSMFPAIAPGQTFRDYYKRNGWTGGNVLRADNRHELDLPLQLGDLKLTPYVTGRGTHWDQEFPEPNDNGSTTRLWGQAGVRGSMEFWRVYDDVESDFWDVHRIRHVVEPEFQVFQTGTTVTRGDLQPFDRDVEGISDASGAQMTMHQKWQTKRGGPGHWRNVDWLVLDVSSISNWHEPRNGPFYPGDPLRGFMFTSRPELSLVRDSINADLTWRVGEWARYMAEESYNVDDARLEQLAQGIAIDQSPYLSYFFGNRYIRDRGTDEWTIGASYKLTRKYTISVTESYDLALRENILTSVTLLRHMPRFNAAFTVNYDANMSDTSFVVTVWPEGMPELGIGNSAIMESGR